LLQLPEFYARMHASSITDTMGAGLALLGLMGPAEVDAR
jgi:multicomponent Na+:H+ antiporter subunit G